MHVVQYYTGFVLGSFVLAFIVCSYLVVCALPSFDHSSSGLLLGANRFNFRVNVEFLCFFFHRIYEKFFSFLNVTFRLLHWDPGVYVLMLWNQYIFKHTLRVMHIEHFHTCDVGV